MTLRSWLASGWLTEHRTSSQEVRALLAIADRDLADCLASGLSPDWRLNIAYNAALQIATVALAACGYQALRSDGHCWTIQTLAHTLGDGRLSRQLDQFRKKRNADAYEMAGTVSDQEAQEMVALAAEMRRRVQAWLEANYASLL